MHLHHLGAGEAEEQHRRLGAADQRLEEIEEPASAQWMSSMSAINGRVAATEAM